MTAHKYAIQSLTDAVMSFQLEAIPADVLNLAKRSLIDVCGVTLAGAKTKSAKLLFETAAQTYGAGNCDIVGSSFRMNAPGAAFANGAAAHALDFDDNCYAGIVHGSAVVFPAVLAAAQQRGTTGSKLLLGFLTGMEVEFAVARALSNSIYDKGWWTTSVLGAIGSAAGAAKVFSLNREMTEHALSLAAVGAGATRTVRGTSAKHYYCGRAAELGVVATIAAKQGATGPVNVFEDRSGIAQVLNDGIFDPTALETLGEGYGITNPGVDIKKYPVCYASHATADAVKEIMDVNGLQASDVASLTCTVPRVVASNLTYTNPRTVAEAQFSLHFAIASIVLHGDITLEHLTAEVLSSASIKRLMKRIDVKVDDIPEQYKSSPLICPEWGYVELATQCGALRRCFVGSPVGSALRPMSNEMLKKKFNACAQYGNCNSSDFALHDKILNIELLQNVQDLFS
jgi:2-methylcitrate dehydratase PrpD